MVTVRRKAGRIITADKNFKKAYYPPESDYRALDNEYEDDYENADDNSEKLFNLVLYNSIL